MNNAPNLGEGKIGSLLVKLALPSIVAQLVNLLYNMVDRIYIGHIPKTGDLALTGLGLCFPVLMMVTAVAALIGFGGAPRIAIYMGKGEDEKAEEIMGNCGYYGDRTDDCDRACKCADSASVWCQCQHTSLRIVLP